MKKKEPEMVERTISHEQVDQWSKEYSLSWQQVFCLDSEFWSLISIENQEKEKGKQRAVGKDTKNLESMYKDDFEKSGFSGAEDKKKILEPTHPTIQLKVFMNYTKVFYSKFKGVILRLISAFGIDITNEHSRIDQVQFLKMKCFFELFTIQKEELQNLWMKILDPRGLAIIQVEEFKQFIERLARGTISSKPTIVSETFSVDFVTMLKAEGCLADSDTKVNLNRLRERMVKQEAIDVELFNQLLRQDCVFKIKSKHFDPEKFEQITNRF